MTDPPANGKRGAPKSLPDDNAGPADVLARLRASLKPLDSVAKLKPTDPAFLEELQKLLLGVTEASRALPDMVEALTAYVEDERARRTAGIGKAVTAFLNASRAKNMDIHEGQRWRIGPLELETNQGRGAIRFMYNDEPVTEWKSAQDGPAVMSAYDAALATIREAEVDQATLTEALAEAYDFLLTKGERVRLKDLYPELRVALIRRDLRQKASKVIKDQALPYWAFLYNLDRYKSLAGSATTSRRLVWETGSQAEGLKFGIKLDGLKASGDRKLYCFAREYKLR